MQNFYLVSLFCLISVSFDLRGVFSRSCDPDDEFENETSPEWDSFMDTVTELTFNKVYEKPCQNNVGQKVAINASSDILWDLRFAVYSERQSKESETIEWCYQQEKDTCNENRFRECMKNARSGMLADITSGWWDERIEQELEKLAEKC